MKKASLIFDFDGTLYDPLNAIELSLNAVLQELSILAPSKEIIKTFIGPPLHISIKNHFGLDEKQVDLIVQKFRKHHAEKALDAYTPYDHMLKTLIDLQKKFELHIASSKPQSLLDLVIEKQNLVPFFRNIVGSQAGDSASKSKYIQAVLNNSEFNIQQTYMIGDRHFDIDAGKSLGTKTVGVTWGYGSAEEIQKCSPDLIFNSFNELQKYFSAF